MISLVDLITRGTPHPDGKILIIGGGIANFTNVAATFKGIIRALKEYKNQLINHSVKIFVRRGGPNYQEGLKGVPIRVFGPDTHITEIVPLALGIDPSKSKTSNAPASGLKSIQPGTPPAQAEQAAPIPNANKTVGAIHPRR